MRSILFGMFLMVLGGAAFEYGQVAMKKGNRMPAFVSSGEVILGKMPTAKKHQARLLPFECPPGQRDVMDAEGAVVGCERRQ